ncbi:MAG: hypothetical protein ACFE0J_23380 [Elainellaceae cyanobacterium]
MNNLVRSAFAALLLSSAVLGACSAPDRPVDGSAVSSDEPAASSPDRSGLEASVSDASDSALSGSDGEEYAQQIALELETLDQQIDALKADSPSVPGMKRLLLKQETAHQQLDALQSDVSSSEQKQAMKRAIAQLKRVYERVQTRTQQA